MIKKTEGDIIDRLVVWGCDILHLQKYTKILQQLTKFVIVGVINTAINWTVFAITLSFLPIADEVARSAVASAIAFFAATIFNFWASITWVFDTTNKKTKKRLFLEFAIMTGISFLLFDEAMLAWLVSSNWNPMLAKIVTTICGMIFNFVTRKMFLEDHSKKSKSLKREK